VSLKITRLLEVKMLLRLSPRRLGSQGRITKTLALCPGVQWQHPRPPLLLKKLKLLLLKRKRVGHQYSEEVVQRSLSKHNNHNNLKVLKGLLQKRLHKQKRQHQQRILAQVVLVDLGPTLPQLLSPLNSLAIQQTLRNDDL